MITNILFAICIFLSIVFGFICVGKLTRKNNNITKYEILFMGLGFTGVITKLIGMW